jgi:hypothetical protein
VRRCFLNCGGISLWGVATLYAINIPGTKNGCRFVQAEAIRCEPSLGGIGHIPKPEAICYIFSISYADPKVLSEDSSGILCLLADLLCFEDAPLGLPVTEQTCHYLDIIAVTISHAAFQHSCVLGAWVDPLLSCAWPHIA